MEYQKDTAFQMLSDKALFEINRKDIGDNQGYDYFLEVTPISQSADNLSESKPLIHESFYGAFDEFHERFPWHNYQLDFLDRDFSEYVADHLVEKINDNNQSFRNSEKRNFEEMLGIHLKTKEVEIKTGVFSIVVENLNKVTDYDYQEFVDSYAQEIGQKFKLINTVERWETFNAESFEFVGTLKISGNSVLLRDSDGDIRYVLASDKYMFTANPLTYTALNWEWVAVKRS